MDPLAAYQFHVYLGLLEFGFSKVSGLQRGRETVTYQEGGLNDRVHVLPGPAKTCGTLRLERGIYLGTPLPFYLTGEKLDCSMRIELRGWEPIPLLGKSYLLTGLVVKRWEVGELDALQNGIAVDRFEVDYEYLAVSVV